MNEENPKKKYNWFPKLIVLFIFIILIGFFTMAFDNIKEVKDNIKTKLGETIKIKTESKEIIKTETKLQDELIVKCEEDFEYYSNISEKKYAFSMKILDTKKINNLKEANEFNEIWGSIFIKNVDTENIKEFPIVMFATRIENQMGEKNPLVFVCSNNGELMAFSKRMFLLSKG